MASWWFEKCRHGHKDGECSECEREQRSKIIWQTSPPSNPPIPSPSRTMERVFSLRAGRKEPSD